METLPYVPVFLQEEMPEFSLSLSVSLCTHTEEMSSEDMGRRQLSENHKESAPETKLPTPFLSFFWLCWIFIAVHGLSLMVRWLSCPTAWGILVPQSQIKPVSPALEGGFLTTGPPGKSPDLQHLDLGLPASRTVRNECCVRPPSIWSWLPKKTNTLGDIHSPHLCLCPSILIFSSLHFSLRTVYWHSFKLTSSFLDHIQSINERIKGIVHFCSDVSVAILIDSFSKFLSLCLPYPCIFACCPLFH